MPHQQHTPEPWRNVTGFYGEGLIYSGDTAGVPLPIGKANSTRDADRIVACVNACAGIADPAVIAAMRNALDLVANTGSAEAPPNRVSITRGLFDSIRAIVKSLDA